MNDLESAIKALIIDALQLEDIHPEDIDTDAPLFGDGLGLDSIDALELGVALKKHFGLALATNDPSLCAIGEALSLGHVLSDIWMLSLGTGRPIRDLSQPEQDKIGHESTGWGVLGWVTNGLIEHMMGASSTVSAHQCEQLLGERYLRVTG